MNHYGYEKVGAHSYLIKEVFPGDKGGHGMGFFVGTRQACIVDTGWGVTGNLRKYLSQLTDLPIICLLTHPHPDHAGAAVQFDEIFMSPQDDSIVHWALTTEKRLHDAGHRHENDPQLLAEMEREVTDCSSFTYHPMQDGDRFDLGGLTVEAIAVPGHTPGSMVLYCPEDDILCTGDAVGPTVSLVGEGDEPPVALGVYQKALARLLRKMTAETRLIIGHAVALQSVQMLSDLLAACGNALRGETVSPDSGIRLPLFVQKAKVPVSVACAAGRVLIYSKL